MILSTMNKNNNILLLTKLNVECCREDLNYFNEKLKNLINIEKGTKIGKVFDDSKETKTDYEYYIRGEYCLYPLCSTQKFSRWWYGEYHEKTFKYLDNDFTLFARFLDNFKVLYKKEGRLLYSLLIKDIIELISQLVNGLYNLKQTYISNNKLKSKIDSIIMILLDFKNEEQEQ